MIAIDVLVDETDVVIDIKDENTQDNSNSKPKLFNCLSHHYTCGSFNGFPL